MIAYRNHFQESISEQSLPQESLGDGDHNRNHDFSDTCHFLVQIRPKTVISIRGTKLTTRPFVWPITTWLRESITKSSHRCRHKSWFDLVKLRRTGIAEGP